MGRSLLLWGTLFLVLSVTGCGVKKVQLPELSFPYLAEFGFFQKVENIEGQAKKTPFPDQKVHCPFDFFLKIREVENQGTVTVRFYSEDKDTKNGKPVLSGRFLFDFGEEGKYYEYVLFFDTVTDLKPGTHRYAVYLRDGLLYEGTVKVE